MFICTCNLENIICIHKNSESKRKEMLERKKKAVDVGLWRIPIKQESDNWGPTVLWE